MMKIDRSMDENEYYYMQTQNCCMHPTTPTTTTIADWNIFLGG
jgi:hypothetical protein